MQLVHQLCRGGSAGAYTILCTFTKRMQQQPMQIAQADTCSNQQFHKIHS